MDGWMDGWMDGRMDGWMDEWWLGGCAGRWVRGWLRGLVNGWMDEHISITYIMFSCLDPFRFVQVCFNSDLQQDICTVLY